MVYDGRGMPYIRARMGQAAQCSPRRPALYARVVTGGLKTEALGRGLAILERDVRPPVGARAGFRGWALLVERATGRFRAISRWGSRVESEGATRDGFTDRAGLLAGTPEGELEQTRYDVRSRGILPQRFAPSMTL